MEEFEDVKLEAAEEEKAADAETEQAEKGGDKKNAALQKVKEFLLKNKDTLILAGQLALVLTVCVAGIKNDLAPQDCRCKKCRKKKKKKRKK